MLRLYCHLYFEIERNSSFIHFLLFARFKMFDCYLRNNLHNITVPKKARETSISHSIVILIYSVILYYSLLFFTILYRYPNT